MARCPSCRQSIPLSTIFFAILPTRITCPGCATVLHGNWFVKMQGVLKVSAIVAVCALALWRVLTHVESPLHRVVAFLGIVLGLLLILGLPLAILTSYKGRYSRR